MNGWERANQSEEAPPKRIKKPSDEKFTIDTREPGSMSRQFEIFKVPHKIDTLTFGDYELKHCLAERKTIFDFVASFRNTRIFDQLEGLVSEDCYPFLIIVGTMEDLLSDVHFKGINEATVFGAMASCMCRYGVNVIWVQHDSDAVLIMSQLFKEMSTYQPPVDEMSDNFCMLAGTLKELTSDKFKGTKRNEVMQCVAEMICNEHVNIIWAYDNIIGLRVLSRMFHKVNEGKRGLPRRRMVKPETGDRTTDIVRTFLRVDATLAKSMVLAARKKKMGVLKYIMETPNSSLLAHPGMGQVTLKRIRELVG